MTVVSPKIQMGCGGTTILSNSSITNLGTEPQNNSGVVSECVSIEKGTFSVSLMINSGITPQPGVIQIKLNRQNFYSHLLEFNSQELKFVLNTEMQIGSRVSFQLHSLLPEQVTGLPPFNNDIFLVQSASIYLLLQVARIYHYPLKSATLIWQLTDQSSRLLQLVEKLKPKFKCLILCVLNDSTPLQPILPLSLQSSFTNHLATNVLKSLALRQHPTQVFSFGSLWFQKLAQKCVRYVFGAPVLAMLFHNSSHQLQDLQFVDLREVSADSFIEYNDSDLEIGQRLKLFKNDEVLKELSPLRVEKIQVLDIGCCGTMNHIDQQKYANKAGDIYRKIQFRRESCGSKKLDKIIVKDIDADVDNTSVLDARFRSRSEADFEVFGASETENSQESLYLHDGNQQLGGGSEMKAEEV